MSNATVIPIQLILMRDGNVERQVLTNDIPRPGELFCLQAESGSVHVCEVTDIERTLLNGAQGPLVAVVNMKTVENCDGREFEVNGKPAIRLNGMTSQYTTERIPIEDLAGVPCEAGA